MSKHIRALLIVALVLACAACSAPAEPTAGPPATRRQPTSTPEPAPTGTPAPAPTDTTAPAADPDLIIAKNTTLTQTSAGLIIELRRVVVADKTTMETILGGKFTDASLDPDAFEQADLVGEFILILRNTADKTLSVYPDQSTVLVQGPNGTRQIDLTWAPFGLAGMDSVGGDIYANVTKVGGFWYPLSPGLTLDDIQTITLHIDGPYDDDAEDLPPDYTFEIDLSDRPNDDLTDAVTTP